MTSTSFFIPDTSPLLAYSQDWTAAYHTPPSGQDETFHQTTNEGVISINITASSLHFSTPYSDATPPRCNVQYRLNGSGWTDGCGVADLPAGTHGVDIRPRGQGMQFLGVRGQIRLKEGKHRNVTIDNLAPQFTYSGPAWTHLSQTGSGGAANQTLADQFADRSGVYNQTLSISSDGASTAELRFKGEAVYLYGLSGPEFGSSEIKLDGRTVGLINATLPWREYSSLLFMAGGLGANVEHILTLTNVSLGRLLGVDYAMVTVPDLATPNQLGIIIGAAVGGGILLLLVLLGFWFFLIRRRQRKSRRSPAFSSSARSIGHSTSPQSQSDDKASWRNMPGSGAASPISPVSICFSEDARSFPSKSTTALVHRSPAAPTRYVESELTDYIPYNGPVEHRPESDIESVVVPDIVGASPSANDWLQGQADRKSGQNAGAAGRHLSMRSAYSTASESHDSRPHTALPESIVSPDSSRRAALSHASLSDSLLCSVAPRPAESIPQLSGRSATSPFHVHVPLSATDYFTVPVDWRDRQLQRHPQPEPPISGRHTHTLGDLADVPLTASDFASPPSRTLRLRMESPMLNSPGGDSLRSANQATITRARRVDWQEIAARVWPGRDVVPSYYTASLVPLNAAQENVHPGRGGSGTPEAPPAGPRQNSHGPLSAISSADPSPNTRTGIFRTHSRAPSAVPSSAALTAFFPSTPSTPSLRRGVSVKSAKTARSFFSTLMAGSRSPAWGSGGDVPALPQTGQGPSARPDSDLFGDSVSVMRRSVVSASSAGGTERGGHSMDDDDDERRVRGTRDRTRTGTGTGTRHVPQPLRIAERDEDESPNLFIELPLVVR